METRLFHIFRNTPLGRETLLQSIYFSQQIDASLLLYIPEYIKFLMYFDNDVVQVDLDSSYLASPETAHEHAMQLLKSSDRHFRFLEPKNFTASTLPDIPTNYEFMSCPRSISDLSSKIGLGYIGPRVRRIVQSAQFPVLLTSPVYKPWNSITVLFGGSSNALKALKLGFRIHRSCEKPLYVFTQTEGKNREDYEMILKQESLDKEMAEYTTDWHLADQGKFEENLYHIPHDSLVIVGAYGHGLIRDIVFGSKMENVQSTISNNLLIVGPKYVAAT